MTAFTRAWVIKWVSVENSPGDITKALLMGKKEWDESIPSGLCPLQVIYNQLKAAAREKKQLYTFPFFSHSIYLLRESLKNSGGL